MYCSFSDSFLLLNFSLDKGFGSNVARFPRSNVFSIGFSTVTGLYSFSNDIVACKKVCIGGKCIQVRFKMRWSKKKNKKMRMKVLIFVQFTFIYDAYCLTSRWTLKPLLQ